MDEALLQLKGSQDLSDLTVVIPVYKESPDVVEKLYYSIKKLGCEVIVVDDGDSMELPPYINQCTYYPHMGYGYALKEGIRKASTELVCMCDGDGQHSADDVLRLYLAYKLVRECKMVVGSRWNLKESPIRWIGRKILNFIASCLANHYLVDLNSGLRVIDRKTVLGYMNILCDQFSFTTSCTMSLVADGNKVVYIPITVNPRSNGKSHVKLGYHGLITLWYIIKIGFAMRTRGLRAWIRRR